jgi:hypothetical protein
VRYREELVDLNEISLFEMKFEVPEIGIQMCRDYYAAKGEADGKGGGGGGEKEGSLEQCLLAAQAAMFQQPAFVTFELLHAKVEEDVDVFTQTTDFEVLATQTLRIASIANPQVTD